MKFIASQIAFFLRERDARQNLRGLLKYCAFLMAVVTLFTIVFHFLMLHVENQHHSWATGLYWTLTVMSTLGFGDITFNSDIGRLFSMVVLLSGIVLLLVLLPFTFIRLFYAPWLEARLKQRAPRAVPDGVRDHIILSRYNTIAPGLIDRLQLLRRPYFIIEPDPVTAVRLLDDGVSVIAGEPDNRRTLENLNLSQASLVVANLDDMSNSNVTLTVREISADVPVIALIENEDSQDVLELSGATHAILLKRRLGEHLASRVEAGQTATHEVGRYRDLVVVEFWLRGTTLVGKKLKDSGLRERTGVTVIAFLDRGKMEPAGPESVCESQNLALAVGTGEQISLLEEMLDRKSDETSPVLILGGGKVGRAATRALTKRDVPVVLVEKNRDLEPKLTGIANRLVLGDASDRGVLKEAGLHEASSVILTTHQDAVNIFLAVYCRKLRPELRIVCRCTHEKNVEAQYRAGADFVLSYASLAVETILAILQRRPPIFLGENVEFFVTDLPKSMKGRSLIECGVRARTGLLVIGVERPGEDTTNPSPEQVIEKGSRLFMVGTSAQFQEFRRVFG